MGVQSKALSSRCAQREQYSCSGQGRAGTGEIKAPRDQGHRQPLHLTPQQPRMPRVWTPRSLTSPLPVVGILRRAPPPPHLPTDTPGLRRLTRKISRPSPLGLVGRVSIRINSEVSIPSE